MFSRKAVDHCFIEQPLWFGQFFKYMLCMVQFCPWFKFYFPLFLGMIIYDNEFETKENKI